MAETDGNRGASLHCPLFLLLLLILPLLLRLLLFFLLLHLPSAGLGGQTGSAPLPPPRAYVNGEAEKERDGGGGAIFNPCELQKEKE